MSTDARTTRRNPSATPAFQSIVCGIDASEASRTAVDQAVALAGPGATVDLVACIGSQHATTAQFLLTRPAARRALRRLARVAEDAGARVTKRVIDPGWERHPLLNACAGRDLLVLGTHGGSRALGMLAASTVTSAVHLAPCPVLVARDGSAFPGMVLLADDGTHASGRAASLAGAIAAEHGGDVVVAAPADLPAPRRRRLAADLVELAEATGREPVVVDVEGAAARALPELAGRLGAGLVVLGSRRLTGPRAIGSVSERVAHRAPCSVLVVRD